MSNLQQPLAGRRRFLLGGATAATFGFAGLAWNRRSATPRAAGLPEATSRTVVTFIGVLFGRQLTAFDQEDLGERLRLLQSNAVFNRDCGVLAAYLDDQAKRLGTLVFSASAAADQAKILNDLMTIDTKSTLSHLLSRLFPSERDYHRMRNSTVPQLAWLYRHSAVAWRARGYHRWPGVAGDWHDVLAPGPQYP